MTLTTKGVVTTFCLNPRAQIPPGRCPPSAAPGARITRPHVGRNGRELISRYSRKPAFPRRCDKRLPLVGWNGVSRCHRFTTPVRHPRSDASAVSDGQKESTSTKDRMPTRYFPYQNTSRTFCTGLAPMVGRMNEEPYERLQRARLRAGFKGPAEAADNFGWNKNTYKSHENGIRGLTRASATRYGRAFHVSPAWLLTAEGSDEEATVAGGTRVSWQTPEATRQRARASVRHLRRDGPASIEGAGAHRLYADAGSGVAWPASTPEPGR